MRNAAASDRRDQKQTPTDTATLSIAEVGRHLRRSKAWAYLAAKDGRIPCIQTIAGRRVRRTDFNRLVGLADDIGEDDGR